MLRESCSLVILSSSLLAGGAGCRQTTSLVGAVVCQDTHLHLAFGRPGRWTFDGIDARVPPRIRPGTYASATYGVRFLDPANLGPHRYRYAWSEQNGIIYTCRAGHIDIAHLRKAADWTAYLAAVTLERMEAGQTQFQFKLREPSVYHVALTFPPDWDSREATERERIAREVARDVGQHLAYTALTWHEILTWFGFRPRGYKAEFPSAFSWEDNYSNLLGTHIAAAALGQEGLPYDEAVTGLLQQRLDELEPQSAEVARQASESMRGSWYSRGGLVTRIYKRNLDTGWDDGYVTPCLVPGVAACGGTEPLPLAAPALSSLARYGFSIAVEIEGRVWEQGKILAALDAQGCPPVRRLDPRVHFPAILAYCRTQWAGDLMLENEQGPSPVETGPVIVR
jgi:hypothetical protein